jgi:hypothetical protein
MLFECRFEELERAVRSEAAAEVVNQYAFKGDSFLEVVMRLVAEREEYRGFFKWLVRQPGVQVSRFNQFGWSFFKEAISSKNVFMVVNIFHELCQRKRALMRACLAEVQQLLEGLPDFSL